MWEHVWYSYPVQLTGAIGCVGTMDPRGTYVTQSLEERPSKRSKWGKHWHLMSFRNFFQDFALSNCLTVSAQTISSDMNNEAAVEPACGVKGLNYLSLTHCWLGFSGITMYCCLIFLINVINVFPQRYHTFLTTHRAGRCAGLQMYKLKACLFSIWAGQSLWKYVQSRRAASSCTAAHTWFSMGAFSFVFSFPFHRLSHVSVIINSLMLGQTLRTEKVLLNDITVLCTDALNKTMQKMLHISSHVQKMSSWVTFGQQCLFPSWPKLQNCGFTHLKMLCLCVVYLSAASSGIFLSMFTIIFLGEKKFT